MAADPFAVLLVSRRDRDLVPRVPGLDALDEHLTERAVSLVLREWSPAVVDELPGAVDSVRHCEDLIRVKERAEHEDRVRPRSLLFDRGEMCRSIVQACPSTTVSDPTIAGGILVGGSKFSHDSTVKYINKNIGLYANQMVATGASAVVGCAVGVFGQPVPIGPTRVPRSTAIKAFGALWP